MVSGAPFTMAVGVVYLASFLIVEGLLSAVRTPLNAGDRVKAIKLVSRMGTLKIGSTPTNQNPIRPKDREMAAKANISWE